MALSENTVAAAGAHSGRCLDTLEQGGHLGGPIRFAAPDPALYDAVAAAQLDERRGTS